MIHRPLLSLLSISRKVASTVLLFTLLLLCTRGRAQNGEAVTKASLEPVVDVIHLHVGEPLEGKILEYEWEKKIVLVTTAGDLQTLTWDEIKRVSFHYDAETALAVRERVNAERADEKASSPDLPALERDWHHQVSGGINFGSTLDRFGSVVLYGYSLSYHYVRPVGPLLAGIGLDATLFSYRRAEYLGAVTGLVEYAIAPRKRNSFYLRLEGGPSIPFGTINSDEQITDRRVGFLLHPSIGFEWGGTDETPVSLYVDVGYRFADATFTLETETLDVLLRETSYQRFSLRSGLRF